MLTSLNRMTGLPVVWQDRQIGCVERAVADVNVMRLSGVVIRKGIGSAKWAPAEGILLAGRQSVVLSREPVRMPRGTDEPVRRAVLTSGGCAGEVSDALIHGDTLRIAALEVSQGLLHRLMGRRQYAVECRLNPYGEPGEVIVAGLLSWTQLLRRIGEEDER